MPRPPKRKAALAGAALRYSVLDKRPNADILNRKAIGGNVGLGDMTDPYFRESEKQKAVTTNHGFLWTSHCTTTITKYSDPVFDGQSNQGLEVLKVLQTSRPQRNQSLRIHYAI